jgi:PAS domain-containing protein
VQFKPNKHSILLSVVDYIKQLQSRAIMLDAEHHRLIQTIRQTSEMVNSGPAPEHEANEEQGSDAEMLFVQGLDYQSIFDQGTAAMGIAALDGRILACNHEFVNLLGYSREELLRQSLFSVMQNHEEVFKAMAEMLKAETINDGLGDTEEQEKQPLHWSGVVSQTDQSVSACECTVNGPLS